jgi:WD40 repeat protein
MVYVKNRLMILFLLVFAFAQFGLCEESYLFKTLSSDAPDRFRAVYFLSFSPDGKYIASAGKNKVKLTKTTTRLDNTITIWDVSTGRKIRTLNGHGDCINAVTYSPDGKYIASGSYDKTVKIWIASTGKVIRTIKGHSNRVNSLSFSPDGKYIASGSSDKTIMIWDAATGENIKTLRNNFDVIAIAYSPDGKYIASVCTGSSNVTIWDTSTGEPIRSFNGGYGYVFSVAYSQATL